LGILSILPPVIAVVLAFWTRNAIFALAFACLVGCTISGGGVFGFPDLLRDALGTTTFSWILLLELFIGILIAFFQKAGAIQGFTTVLAGKNLSRRRAQLTAWVLGMFVFFSDYFSPLFVGATMRSLTDKAKISREKLAYIADSTAAPVIVLIPFTGWAVFIIGLLIGIGPITDERAATMVFVESIGLNFYAIVAVLLVGLIASGLIPDFGPMKTAENRAMEEGKVLRDGARPLISAELTDTPVYQGFKTNLFLNFFLPVLIVLSIAMGTFIFMRSAKTMEAFLATVIVLGVTMRFQGMPLDVIMKTATDGMKGIMPVIILLALAYAINQLSRDMGTAEYIVSITKSWMTPHLMPCLAFLLAAVISFSTGTSWGTFGIVIPIAVPLAFAFSGDVVTVQVLATIAAVTGGGVFGDHCSPLSDTTILSSFGAASDHIDHVKTQLPYSSVAGVIAFVAYLVIGLFAG
jgi:Na+/H+ antiporter NhaC